MVWWFVWRRGRVHFKAGAFAAATDPDCAQELVVCGCVAMQKGRTGLCGLMRR